MKDFLCPECGHDSVFYREDVAHYHSILGQDAKHVYVSLDHDEGESTDGTCFFHCANCDHEWKPEMDKLVFGKPR